jgi:glutathione synthase/RimK-type ligase-like ATP-grasp enzyme
MLMLWLFGAARRLRQKGVLGINARNAAYILDRNPRSQFPLVDDKLLMRDLCIKIGVPTPEVYAVISYPSMLRRLPEYLGDRGDFVVKPNHGSAGRGVLVIEGREMSGGGRQMTDDEGRPTKTDNCKLTIDNCQLSIVNSDSSHAALATHYLRHNGERLSLDELRQHLSSILSGMYSLGGHPDQAILQQRVRIHPAFEPLSYKGIPDIRVVLYKDEPAMAMLRLPTRESGGRANLHQGGVGVGVDLDTGITNHAVLRNRAIDLHPDTRLPVVGTTVPFWPEVLEMSRRVSREVRLGYLGVDIVIDRELGPMLLEANARPGLAIQIANNKGLLHSLAEIDRTENNRMLPDKSPTVIGQIGTPPLRKSA